MRHSRTMVRLFISIVVLLVFQLSAQKKLPEANQKVIDYVKSVMGTQVGLGECTDLLMMAQVKIRNVPIKEPIIKMKRKQEVLPGDFVGFENAVVGGLSFPSHYAIILEVESPNIYIIAHQNHNGNKIVQQLRLDLNNLSSGKVSISRPSSPAGKATPRPTKKKSR